MTISSAADRVVRELGADLHRFVRRRVKDPATTEDLVQEILLRVIERLGTLRDEERLAPWVFRIARSVVVDHHRRVRPTVPFSDRAADPPSEEDLNGEVASWLPAMLAELPAPYREALRLVEVDGLTQRELAARVGLSPSGAKSRVQRARRMLAGLLDACCRVDRDRRGNVMAWQPRACRCGTPTVG